MNKICFGCGAKLQSTHASIDGYIPKLKEDSSYCQRCFRMIHYGENRASSTPKSINEIISSVNKDNKHVCFLIDFFNITTEVINIYKSITKNKTLLISKSDIIPKQIVYDNIKEFLKEHYEIQEDIIFTSNKKLSANKLINYFNKNNIKECYFLGLSNSGKSTLINNLIDCTNSKCKKLTVNYNPNTTLDFVRLNLNSLLIIDSPGFIINTMNINDKETYKKEVKPKCFQMRKEEVLRIMDNIYIGFSKDTSAVCYIPETIKVHKDYKQKAFSYEKTILPNSDLIIKGLGFINIKNECKIFIKNIEEDLIEVRKSIFRG